MFLHLLLTIWLSLVLSALNVSVQILPPVCLRRSGCSRSPERTLDSGVFRVADKQIICPSRRLQYVNMLCWKGSGVQVWGVVRGRFSCCDYFGSFPYLMPWLQLISWETFRLWGLQMIQQADDLPSQEGRWSLSGGGCVLNMLGSLKVTACAVIWEAPYRLIWVQQISREPFRFWGLQTR